MRRRFHSAGTLLAFVLSLSTPPVAHAEIDGDSDEKSPVVTRILSAADARETENRQRTHAEVGKLLEQAELAQLSGDSPLALQQRATAAKLAGLGTVGTLGTPLPGMPESAGVNAITHVPQETTYWCGPATVVILVKAKGKTISQRQAATDLGTTTNGTGWAPGSTAPMSRTLRKHTGYSYMAYAVNDRGDTTQRRYRGALVSTVGNGMGLAANTVRYRGTSVNLVGHPDRTIYHWIAIRGYRQHGATTNYVDPAAGSKLGWSGVPNYSAYPTVDLVRLMVERGYVSR